MKKLTRRRFLQTAAVASAATQMPLRAEPAPTRTAWPENGTLIPDDGWRLWVDEHAAWQNDEIFLPEDVSWVGEGKDAKLCGKGQPLAVNAPTGGWGVLTRSAGKEVLLPTTVEAHFWGKYGAGADAKPRPYTPAEYRYAADTKDGTQPAVAPADDDVPQNGAYFGVSWWWREIEIPASMQGKRIFLHIRGARLRAEVYLNEKLVGYSIMEELPFECDLTHAAVPGGKNVLAIRLTNPFGRFDWVDGANAKWGQLSLYRSHGFAGLDRGMTVSAHSGVRIKNVWVLNKLTTGDIVAKAEVESLRGVGDIDQTLFEVVDLKSRRTVAQSGDLGSPSPGLQINVVNGSDNSATTETTSSDLHLDNPHIWDLEKPDLYYLRVTTKTRSGHTDTRTIAFGFRSFGPTGLGPASSDKAAMFRLNGRRIRIYSSISWGFWGLNGLFPVPELAEKEVVAAKTLGLNCLNFHRNLAKEDVLRKHDELGVLRYMEPGAGKLAIGKLPANTAANTPGTIMEKPQTEAEKFAQRFMFVKCVEMVKAYRSHPSVIEYCLQNEIGADLNNPDTLAVLKAMHDEDPSRCVVLNDGFVAEPRKAAQAWYGPWDDTLHRSDKEPWGDWWNQHQGAGDQWYDEFYKSPTDFTYRAPYKNVITEYGEMEGCARPDNHPLMVHQITETYKKYGGNSYDLVDHEEIIAGYERFIAKWGFRAAFPTTEALFHDCGRTCYESWQNYMENARLSDDLDMAVISGWESTAIENHSGIVDNLRNFKSDPNLIAGSLLPVRPIAKQRSLVVALNDRAVFDLFLANDTPTPATGTLTFRMTTPSGNTYDLLTLPAPEQTPDVFVYLLKTGFTSPEFHEQGLHRFEFLISSAPQATQTRDIWVTDSRLLLGSVEVTRAQHPSELTAHPLRLGVSGITPALRKQLAALNNVAVEDVQPGKEYAVIITSGLTAKTSADQNVGETTGDSASVQGAAQTTKEVGHIDPAVLDAVRAGTPLLCIPQADSLSDGCAQQLAAAGAFAFHGNVGDYRAPWMGNWYFNRKHAIFDGMPTDAALGGFYQVPARQSNGLLVDRAPGGAELEVLVGYSRDHDRKVGAGTFTTRLGNGKLLYHRMPTMHPVMQQRFLANAIRWLIS